MLERVYDIRQWKLMHVSMWKEEEIQNIKEIEERSDVIVLFKLMSETEYYVQ